MTAGATVRSSQINTDNVKRLQPAWVFSTGDGQRPRSAADRRQRRDVRGDARQSGARHQREDGHAAVALPPPAADARRGAASDEPRRGGLRRQGVFRGRRSGARRARCENGRGSLDDARGRQRERLLHVARAARRRRQSADRHVRRRAGHPRLCLGVRCRNRQGAVEDLHGARARRAGQRNLAEGRGMEDRRRRRCGSRRTTIPRRTCRSGAPATAARGWAIGGPATTCTSPQRWRIDVATGQIKGHMQYNPNESWDWDEVSPPILVDYQRSGRTIKGLINVGAQRLSCISSSERPARSTSSRRSRSCGRTSFAALDPKTGRPDVDPDKKPGTDKMADFCPSWWGGKNWPPDRVQPEDADDLHSGQRESVRRR